MSANVTILVVLETLVSTDAAVLSHTIALVHSATRYSYTTIISLRGFVTQVLQAIF